jgi:hypothetical protein
MSRKKEWKVPLDDDGNLLHWARPESKTGWGANYKQTGINWVEPFEFQAYLQIDRLETGRTAKYVWWTDLQTGNQYPMFVADVIKLVKAGCQAGGKRNGLWRTVKRGQNFGITPA